MYKDLYVFGCSFTKDNYQKTWAQFLADRYKLNLHNHAERGAGAGYVVKRLLVSDIDPATSIVAILWPSADRFDLWADNTVPHLVNDKEYASWPNGTEPKFVDYHGNYVDNNGFNLNGSIPRGYKNYYYKYFYSPQSVVHDWYTNIITAQLYLKSKNIPHIMGSAFPLQNPIHYHHGPFEIVNQIYNQIDLNVFVENSNHQGFFTFCKSNNLPFLDDHHPKSLAHQMYVDQFMVPKFKLFF